MQKKLSTIEKIYIDKKLKFTIINIEACNRLQSEDEIMKSKKLIPFALVALTLMGCSNSNGTGGELTAEVKDAMTLDYDALVAKAKEEVGDNTVQVYGNSSQLVTALEAFTSETGIKVESNKLGDAELYSTLGPAFEQGKYIADMVLLQDGNMLQNEMLKTGYLLNYIPKEAKDTIAEDDREPMAAVYLNKIFMYNNVKDGVAGGLTNYFTNIWQVAGSAEDGDRHISGLSFKTPSTENVNLNFLAMVISGEYEDDIKSAYKSYYGKDYAPTAEETKQYPTIGHKWVAEFLTNSIAHSSDGTACKDTAKTTTSGAMALVNYNKIKDLKSEGVGTEDVANLSFPSLELDNTKVEGFGGFCYKMYSMVAKNAKYPYAACALVSYITSKTGFENAWGTKAGYYSTNTTTSIASNDKELSWWKERLVIEDPEIVAANYEDTQMFVANYEKASA